MVMSIDDPRLVESFRAGENEAFEALVRAHRPALYRHALRRLTDHASAEDAVQETFTRAYRSRARVGDDWRLSAWLHQILANVCIDEANRRRRETDKAGRWATTDMPSRGVTPDLDMQLGLDADHSEVVEALRLLPSQYQEALSLRYGAELEYDEMAAVLEVSEENARARVSRASKAMRLLLRPVAALIAFMMATVFRRGSKAAQAMSIGDSATAATTASHTSTIAANFAPLIETAQAVVVQAPTALPTIGKAAIGIGMLVVATAPATAPAIVDRLTTDTDESSVSAGELPADSGDAVVVDTADGSALTETGESSESDAASTDSIPVFIAGETPTPEYGSESASEAGATDDAPASSVAAAPLTDPSGEAGELAASGISVTPAGARIDLAGSATLTVGGTAVSGALSGRVSFVTEPDANGVQRYDGVLTVATAEGNVEIRIIGYSTLGDDGSYALSGRFRASGATGAMLTSGSLSGSLDSSLTLSLHS